MSFDTNYNDEIADSEDQFMPPSQDQIKLDLKKSRLDWFYSLKRGVSSVSVVVEALPFWRNLHTVLALLSSVTFVVLSSYSIFVNFKRLSIDVQLIYMQSTHSWSLMNKEFFILVPIGLGALLILAIKLSNDVYRFDRRLSQMINISIIIFNILALIAFYQILSLTLIY